VAVPQELVLYGRTFALLAGVTRAVAPDVNALAIARPLITQALLAGGPREQAA
jgi:predicted unusual protein kinase regulating ubiquinone biosynthesis (AarF/ABC1/UbiB family)